jgi:hypothetical protein
LNSDDYGTALQIGYLLDRLGRKKEATSYFEKVSHSSDKTLREKGYQSLVNLRSESVQLFPLPFFADLYSAPFYYSRFNFAEIPLHLRIGVTFGEGKLFEAYSNFYIIKDTSSSGGNGADVLPSIYNDNYLLLGGGARVNFESLVPFIPFGIYGEIGGALDIVSQNRAPWRVDFRGGLEFFKDWSTGPQFANALEFKLAHIGDVYGDISYFSRYENDVIGYVKAREGVRFLQFKDTSLEAYARVFLILDSNQYFYNNLFEVGPCVALIPINKWPIRLSYEARFGFYIPFNGTTANPYGSWYVAHVAMMELYYRF